MNAPVTIPQSIIAPAGLLQRAIDMMVRLWCEGRSVAGIQMEVANELGLKCSPRRILQRIRRRRRDDPRIPRALYTPEDFARAIQAGKPIDPLDQRADNTAFWLRRRFPVAEGLHAMVRETIARKEA